MLNTPMLVSSLWRKLNVRSHNYYYNFIQRKEAVIIKSMKSNKGGVDELRQIVHSHSSDGWEKSWRQGVTPWDLGQPTPILLHLLQTASLPKGRVLLPGCGSGHDVIAIASPDRYVVGLDISESAIEIATKDSCLHLLPMPIITHS